MKQGWKRGELIEHCKNILTTSNARVMSAVAYIEGHFKGVQTRQKALRKVLCHIFATRSCTPCCSFIVRQGLTCVPRISGSPLAPLDASISNQTRTPMYVENATRHEMPSIKCPYLVKSSYLVTTSFLRRFYFRF